MAGRRRLLLAAVALAAVPAPPALAAKGKAEPVERAYAYPGPGWGYASHKTRITFRGVGKRDLRDIIVRGSDTGRHEGRVRNLRDGMGAVFIPEDRFESGETVTVQAGTPIQGVRRGRFEFDIAQRTGGPPVVSEPRVPTPEPWLDQLVLPCPLQVRTLRTMPGVLPEGMCALGQLSRGHGRLLLSLKPRGNGGPNGRWAAAVLSRTGKLLWYVQAPYELNDLKSIVLDGQRMLALFVRPRGGNGSYVLFDEAYQPVGRVTAGNGYAVDSHDLQVAEDGTLWVGVYEQVYKDGRRRVTDYVVQQLDPRTRDVLFEWHALDHVAPQVSSMRDKPADPGSPWDYFHGNAIEPPTAEDPTILVSARNTSAIYGIHPQTGKVEWILGGRNDRFDMDEHPSWQFCAQHDVRRTGPGELTLFDNGGLRLDPDHCPIHPARTMRFRLDLERREAHLVERRSSRSVTESPTAYFPGSLGSARMAGDGSWLVDWGTTGRVTQERPDGTIGFRMALGQRSYRAVLGPWKGSPSGAPAVALERPGSGPELDVFASWNGATRVRRWQVLAGPAADQLVPVGTADFADLETAIRVQTTAPLLAVQALGRGGKVLRQSHIVGVPPPPSP